MDTLREIIQLQSLEPNPENELTLTEESRALLAIMRNHVHANDCIGPLAEGMAVVDGIGIICVRCEQPVLLFTEYVETLKDEVWN